MSVPLQCARILFDWIEKAKWNCRSGFEIVTAVYESFELVRREKNPTVDKFRFFDSTADAKCVLVGYQDTGIFNISKSFNHKDEFLALFAALVVNEVLEERRQAEVHNKIAQFVAATHDVLMLKHELESGTLLNSPRANGIPCAKDAPPKSDSV
jgi:hypothetical protein